MKCLKCDHEFMINAKFCPECGSKQEIKCSSCGGILEPNARFCIECGSKVVSNKDTEPASGSKVLTNIPLSKLPLDINYCQLLIQDVTAEGPDDDGDQCVTVKYTVTNDGSIDWGYINTHAQLLSADGQIIEESSDAREENVCAGDTLEQEIRFWRVKEKTLGHNPEKAHVLLSFTGSICQQISIGKIAIPETALTTIAIPTCEIDGLIKLVNGSVLKHEADSDNDSRIEVKALIQNLTSQQLPEVRIVAKVTDKHGRELFEADGYDEFRPGSIAVVSGGGYEKANKLLGATIEFSLRAYLPSSQILIQSQGMTIIRPDANLRDESDEENDFSSDEHILGKSAAFEWEMRRGVINIDDIENKETREALESSLSLAKKGKLKEAIRALPEMTFEFSFHNLDSDPSEYFSDTDGIVFDIEPGNPKHKLELEVIDGQLLLNASIIFDLQVRSDVDINQASDWLDKSDGYQAGFLSGGWSYHDDNGGRLSVACEKSAIISSNSLTDLKLFAESLRSKLLTSGVDLQKIYVAPHISEKRIKKGIASYAPNLLPSEVVVLIDSTLFGGGSDGLILSETGLFAKDLMGKPKSVKFTEVKVVEFNPDGKDPALRVNGLDFLNTAGVSNEAMNIFAKLLNETYGEIFSKNAQM